MIRLVRLDYPGSAGCLGATACGGLQRFWVFVCPLTDAAASRRQRAVCHTCQAREKAKRSAITQTRAHEGPIRASCRADSAHPQLEPPPLALAHGIGCSSLFSRASSPVRVQTRTESALAWRRSPCQQPHNALISPLHTAGGSSPWPCSQTKAGQSTTRQPPKKPPAAKQSAGFGIRPYCSRNARVKLSRSGWVM